MTLTAIPCARQVVAQTLGEVDHRGLGRPVGRRQRRQAAVAGNGGHHGDVAGTALQHGRQQRLDAVDDALVVHGHGAGGLGGGEIARRHRLPGAGVEHGQIDGPERARDAAHRFRHRRGIEHVERKRRDARMGAGELGKLVGGARGGRDLDAALGQRHRQRAADAGAGPGDPCCAPPSGHGPAIGDPAKGCSRRATRPWKRSGFSLAIRQMQSPPASVRRAGARRSRRDRRRRRGRSGRSRRGRRHAAPASAPRRRGRARARCAPAQP